MNGKAKYQPTWKFPLGPKAKASPYVWKYYKILPSSKQPKPKLRCIFGQPLIATKFQNFAKVQSSAIFQKITKNFNDNSRIEVEALLYFANTSNSRTISKSQGQSFAVPNGTRKIWTTK